MYILNFYQYICKRVYSISCIPHVPCIEVYSEGHICIWAIPIASPAHIFLFRKKERKKCGVYEIWGNQHNFTYATCTRLFSLLVACTPSVISSSLFQSIRWENRAYTHICCRDESWLKTFFIKSFINFLSINVPGHSIVIQQNPQLYTSEKQSEAKVNLNQVW